MTKKLTPEQIAEMRKLRAEGLEYREIAEKFGVSHVTVYYHTSDRKDTKHNNQRLHREKQRQEEAANYSESLKKLYAKKK